MMNSIFFQSLSQWWGAFSFDKLIMLVMAFFVLIGGADHILGNKYGYGAAFEQGLSAAGSLMRSVAAIYACAPLLSRLLTPIITPLFTKIGADPAAFAGIILSSDMGGYALSMNMSASPALGNFCGLILAGTVGSLWVFTIPVAFSIIDEGDRSIFTCGILCGLIAIPFGCLAGGLLMAGTDYALPVRTILINMVPLLVLAVIVCLGLWFKAGLTTRVFVSFGKAVSYLATVLTAIAAFEQITGILLPAFDVMMEEDAAGMTGLDEGLLICAKIALVLAGAFPMVLCIRRHCSGLLAMIGRALSINSAASLGFFTSCVNAIPMFSSMKDMDERGKLFNAAFAAGGAFALGDYLGYASEAEPQMVLPMLGAKIISGVAGVVLAYLLAPFLLGRGKGDVQKGRPR